MEEQEIAKIEISYLAELLNNPSRKEGSVLRIFHELFQITHEGRDLQPLTVEWLSEKASHFLSFELLKILFKLRLEIYCFQFAALNLIDIDDVIDDLSNGDILKGIQSLPPGAFRKLKRELLAPLQPNSLNQSKTIESTSTIEIETLLDLHQGRTDSLKELHFIQDLALSSAPNAAISLPLNIPEPQRLVGKLLPHCRFIGKNPSGMELYQLPLNMEAQSRSSKTDRWVFGSPSPTKVESKTILMMGATGSGKTTLINAMINYIFGVEWDDPVRFMLISEEDASSLPNSQAHSQTSKVTAYELHYQEGFKIPFSLIIVDTPGYADTKGVERDYEITDAIQQFFKDEKGIQELDAVGFTVQSALARLTASQKYIFESILAIFGNDVRDNISFLVTFTDGQTPPVLDAIKEAKIAHQLDAHGQLHHHRFNSSGYFCSNQMNGENDFGPMFWKLATKNFESFFSGLSSMKTISLTLTKQVLEERKHINVTIEGLTLKIHNQLTKMEELHKTKQAINTHLDQINANKDFKYDVTVSRGEKIYIADGKCTTNCSKCSMSCHFPCRLAMTADKQQCAAMGSDGLCRSCPLKCKWDLHLNQNYHWVFKDVTETKTYEEILQKYENAVQKKLSTEGVLQALESELEQSKYDLNLDIETITACLRRLDQIALRPDAYTTTDYIELMIQSEKKEKKPGFKERILSLNSLLVKARVVQKIRAGESIFPEEDDVTGQSGSKKVVVTTKAKPTGENPDSAASKWESMWKQTQQFFLWDKNGGVV